MGTQTSISQDAISILRSSLGGKGAQLAFLKSHALPVPDFIIITSFFAQELLEQREEASEFLHATLKDWSALHPSSSSLSPQGGYAVRSSMAAEDSGSQSYAGILETYLHVKTEDLEARVRDCIRSAKTARTQAYQKSHASPESGGDQIAVVIQVMIPSEKSGVAFSRAPKGNSARIWIDAGLGLGEGIVSGEVPVDQFILDRFLEPLEHSIAMKTTRYEYDSHSRKVTRTPVPPEVGGQPCLCRTELRRLGETLLKIEALHGHPVDVEWAFHRDQLWILQSRPITQEFPVLDYYADTNLSESYPGITSPLTASFVKEVYRRVFTSTAVFLGAGKKRLLQLKPHYACLIESIDDHLYYHLNSYYAAISAMPGGRKNLEAWHRMVGGTPITLSSDSFSPLSGLELLRMLTRVSRFLISHREIFREFNAKQDARLLQLQETLKGSASSKETAQLILQSLDGTDEWALPTFNDVLVMKFTEMLVSELKKSGLPETHLGRLIQTTEGVESLKPLEKLKELASRLVDHPAAIEGLDVVAGLPELRSTQGSDRLFLYTDQGVPSDFIRELEIYLAKYGERSFEELKLESETFRENPAQILRIIAGFARVKASRQDNLPPRAQAPLVSNPHPGGEESPHKNQASARLSLKGRFARLWVQKSIEARESSRLRRGRFYGWFREAFQRFHTQIRSENYELFSNLSFEEKFALTLEDLTQLTKGDLTPTELRERLRAREGWRATKSDHPEFLAHPRGSNESPTFRCFSLSQNSDRSYLSSGSNEGPCETRGLGAANGKARGRALILHSPDQAIYVPDLENCILITQSTDPAWVFLMARARGLISEKGSLLSHTAIIGRELKIPTVVGVSDATRVIPHGATVTMDGETGKITWGHQKE